MIKPMISWTKRILLVFWLVVVFLLGALLAQKNAQLVSVNFLFWQTPEVSTGMLICLVFAVGAVVGVLAVAPFLFWHRRHAKKLKSKNEQLQQKTGPGPLEKLS